MSEGRLRDDRDAADDIARKLVMKGADLRLLEGEAHLTPDCRVRTLAAPHPGRSRRCGGRCDGGQAQGAA